MNYAQWLSRHTAGIRLNTAVRIAAGVVQVLLSLLTVWLSKHFIDVSIRTGTDNDIVQTVCLLVATAVGAIVLRQAYFYLTTLANTRQTNRLRLQMFSGLFSRQLFDEHNLHSGDVVSRLAKDIEVVGDATTSILPQMLITALQLLGAFLLMRSMDARLAWALLLLTPLAVVFAKFIARRLRRMTLDIREDESRIQMQIQEGMEHNAVLRSLDSEQMVTGRLDNLQQRLKGNVMRRTRFTVVTRLAMASCFTLGYFLAFVWGGLQLRDGVITFGVMTSFLQLVGMIQQPILSLLNMLPQLVHATASIDRLEEITQDTDERPYPTNLTPHSTFNTQRPLGIRAEDITFRYASGDREILSHFTHDFAPGTKTAIMGPTGIGKTTLFRMMLALVKPDNGTLTVYDSNGTRSDINEQTRTHFVFVPQGNTLMSGSIRYNLLLARPEATDTELLAVLHTAMADFVAELPDGLDTELGERGTGLSEGQAQRIAIARGLLRPGSILLFDEISSALDEQTERELFARLFAACPDKTMLLITHRTAVAELCDNILPLTPNT